MFRFRMSSVLLGLLLLLTACGRTNRPPHYFSYMDVPAEASLSGTLGDVTFCALLKSAGRANGVGAGSSLSCDFTLTYLSPEALAGVRVDYTAATGKIAVALGDLCATGETYAALATPGLLLLTESSVLTSTQGADGSSVFTTADGARRVSSADGAPVSFSRTTNGYCVDVQVEWERKK